MLENKIVSDEHNGQAIVLGQQDEAIEIIRPRNPSILVFGDGCIVELDNTDTIRRLRESDNW